MCNILVANFFNGWSFPAPINTIGVLFFNWISEKVKYPEFTSSQAAYHAVYGDNRERLEILDAKAKDMGYEDFNDYRIRTW